MPALPGFRDFYPDACATRNAMFATWRDVAHRYGFAEYDGPPLEDLELYTKKSGEEIAGQLFHFTDRGERNVALRPEMTPTVARMVAARHKDFRKPMKWFAIPQLFRYERMQRGRLREHYQLNCDIVGEPGLGADIELVAMCIDMLRGFGLTEQDVVVRLSDRVFWTDFLKERNVPEADWYAVFQAIDKAEREPRDVTAQKLGPLAEPILKILDEGATSERLETVRAGLAARGLDGFVKIDLAIIRGLAYYTGIVFEVFDRSGELRAICGGGRYDTLLKNLGGVDLPALGFGMGDVTLGELLKMRGKISAVATKLDAFVVIPEETARPQAAALVQQLRDAGLAIDYPLAAAKMGKQFEMAEYAGAKYAVVVGGKSAEGEVELKELATRAQRAVKVGELAAVLRS